MPRASCSRPFTSTLSTLSTGTLPCIRTSRAPNSARLVAIRLAHISLVKLSAMTAFSLSSTRHQIGAGISRMFVLCAVTIRSCFLTFSTAGTETAFATIVKGASLSGAIRTTVLSPAGLPYLRSNTRTPWVSLWLADRRISPESGLQAV